MQLDTRYEDIAKSHWIKFESDDEHADRVERATNEANFGYYKAVAGPLAVYRQTMADIAPYRGAPKWDRMKAEAQRVYREATSEAFNLFLRSFEDHMRDGDESEETSLLWDALFAKQDSKLEVAA